MILKMSWVVKVSNEVFKIHLDFLPNITQSYKYLGIRQLGRDTRENFELIEEKVLTKTAKVFQSTLTTQQKVRLFNSSVVPTAT